MGWWPCNCGGTPNPCGGCSSNPDTMAFVIAAVVAGAGGKACCTDFNDTWTAAWRAPPYSTTSVCNYHSVFECGSYACCATTFTYTPGFPSPPSNFKISRIVTDLQIEPDGPNAYARASLLIQTDDPLPPLPGSPTNVYQVFWEASGLPADCTTWSNEVFTFESILDVGNNNFCDFSSATLEVSAL